MKKISALIIFLILLLSGCTIDDDLQKLIDEAESSNEARRISEEAKNASLSTVSYHRESDTVFSLAYYSSDTLNPVNCTTEYNSLVAALTHEGLFELSDTCFPVGVLCETYSYDGTKYLFTLKEAYYNRSGERVTSEDAAYSLSLHLSELPSVRSFYAVDDRTVAAELNFADGGLPAKLTYPIIPVGSANEEYPDGTGKYMISDGKLIAVRGTLIDTIELCPISNISESVHSFETKAFDLAYTSNIATSTLNFSGTMESHSVPTRILHSIVFNTNSPKLRDVQNRKYLSSLMDVDLTEAFGDNTDETDCIFPKHSYLYMSTERPISDISEWDGTPLTVMVNMENGYKCKAAELIAENMRKNGVPAEVSAVKWETFEANIASGNFDMAYVQLMLPTDLSPRTLLGYAGYSGADAELYTFESAELLMRREAAKALNKKITEDCPIVPLCFERKIWITHMGDIQDVEFGVETPFRYIENWIQSCKIER